MFDLFGDSRYSVIVRMADVDFHPGLYSYTRNIGGIQECIDSGLNVASCGEYLYFVFP